jgi:hypothetical protein
VAFERIGQNKLKDTSMLVLARMWYTITALLANIDKAHHRVKKY